MRIVIATILIGVTAMNGTAEDKPKEKLPAPWEQTVKLRALESGKLIDPIEVYAYTKEIKGETVFEVKHDDVKNKGALAGFAKGSEITAEDGTVYVVTRRREPSDRGSHTCWVKKKDPQPKKDK